MVKISFCRLICILPFILGRVAVSSGFQEIPMDLLLQTDIYTIYSFMMTNPRTSHGPVEEEICLIAGKTGALYQSTPCVRVPSEYEASFQEALSEYNQRKNTTVNIMPELKIAKPYQLLNDDEIKEFIEIHRNRPTPYPNPTEFLLKATDLYSFGNVYFNRNRTFAMTTISTFCGSLCGRSDWRVFIKTNTGQWQERPWVTCRSVA